MMLRLRIAILFASLLLISLPSRGIAQGHSYTEGNVINISYIRTKPGMFDRYMQFLATDYKKVMEESKKSGLIVDYGVYSSPQANENDWDLVLTTTYKNMAALDNLGDKNEPILQKVVGQNAEQAAKASAERGAMRDLVGSRIVRQLVLK